MREVPIQVPGENEILVKVSTIGINPTDWKSKRLPDDPLAQGGRLWVFSDIALQAREPVRMLGSTAVAISWGR